jgi:hypothetical protein
VQSAAGFIESWLIEHIASGVSFRKLHFPCDVEAGPGGVLSGRYFDQMSDSWLGHASRVKIVAEGRKGWTTQQPSRLPYLQFT